MFLQETKVYGAPELSYHHSRGEFIKSLNKETAPVNLVKEVVFPLANDSGECDMETEDINDGMSLRIICFYNLQIRGRT